jgi:hypothetical protein
MSVVRKVELLNVPYRFYGFTVVQLLLLFFAGLIGFHAAMNVPNVKVFNGLPLGFLVFMGIFCGAMVFVFANQIRPLQWWRNKLLYTLGIRPSMYVPCHEPAHIYPDANIIESKDASS